MSTILLSSKQMIPEIREHVKKFFDKDIREYRVLQGEKFEIRSPWHDADYNSYTCWRLLPDNHAELVGEKIDKFGGDSAYCYKEKISDELEVKDGYVVVMVGIYPQRCEIYTSANALRMLPENELILTDEEFKDLAYRKMFTSSYRNSISPTSFEIFSSLLNKGLIHKHGGISKCGKMYLLNNEDRMKKVKGY